MSDVLYFQELHNLISRIWPQLVGHYTPITASFVDPRDKDPIEPEACVQLVVGEKKSPFHVNSERCRKWAELKDIVSSALLQNTIDALSNSVHPDEKKELEELEEAFHQFEDSSYLKMVFEKMGFSIDKTGKPVFSPDEIGETVFGASQPLSMVSEYRGLLDSGIAPKEVQNNFHQYLTSKLVDCLFGTLNDNLRSTVAWKLHIATSGLRENLCSAFLTALVRQELPELKSCILLCSDIMQNPYRRDCKLLFIAVDLGYCQSFPWLLQDAFSETDNSFLQQVIQILFEKQQDIYSFGLYHSNVNSMIDIDAVIRLAVRDLTEGRGLPPYTLFNQISATYSEGSVCNGTLVFFNQKPLEEWILFEQPIPLQTETVRYVRKLLEMTNAGQDDYVLLADVRNQTKAKVVGLALRRSCENLYAVEFRGLVKWTLLKAGDEIVSYQDGSYVYHLNHSYNDLDALYHFLSCTNEDVKTIRCIVDSAWKQKHGTMLVIFRKRDDAINETERLVSLSRGIKLDTPQNFAKTCEDNLLLSLSSIDGAILLDRAGTAFGFGIIVDGNAIAEGTPERGARYNSAKNYVACCGRKELPCAALVISEDQSLDILFSHNGEQ